MAPKAVPVRKCDPETRGRQQILNAALSIFAHKGYAATSVREIVNAAGLTAPTLYYYFGSKEGLYLELMKVHCAMIDHVLSSHTHTSTNATERLRDLIDKIFQHVIDDKDFFRLMFAIYYGPSQGAPYCDFISYHVKFHAAIKNIIDEGIDSGEFQPGNSAYMTWMIRGIVQLAMEEQLRDNRPKIDRTGLQKMIDFMRDLLSRPPQTAVSHHERSKSPSGIQGR